MPRRPGTHLAARLANLEAEQQRTREQLAEIVAGVTRIEARLAQDQQRRSRWRPAPGLIFLVVTLGTLGLGSLADGVGLPPRIGRAIRGLVPSSGGECAPSDSESRHAGGDYSSDDWPGPQ